MPDTALLDLLAQVKFLTCSRCCLAPVFASARKRWIQSRLTLLALLGFIHGLFLGWRYSAGLCPVGLVSWRMVREAHHVKSLFNTGVVLYLTGIAVLVLLG